MNNYRYDALVLAEQIINTSDTTLPDPEFLREPADLAKYLQSWNVSWKHEVDTEDLDEVLVLRRRLRSVFEARDITAAIGVLNALLEGVWVGPQVGLTPDGRIKLELNVEENVQLARRLGAEAALGLIAALEHYGVERLHVCHASPCTDVFIDTSRNHSRRYCCEQCASRHNVAAYRQRQRTG